MRNFAAYLLLLYPLILFACPQGGQRNLVNNNTILLDSTATDNRVKPEETLLIDSAKVAIFATVLDANTINISVYKDREGVFYGRNASNNRPGGKGFSYFTAWDNLKNLFHKINIFK